MVGESADSVTATVGPGSSGNKMPTLEEYGTNLTKLAEEVIESLYLLMTYDMIHQCGHRLIMFILLSFAGKIGSCSWKAAAN